MICSMRWVTPNPDRPGRLPIPWQFWGKCSPTEHADGKMGGWTYGCQPKNIGFNPQNRWFFPGSFQKVRNLGWFFDSFNLFMGFITIFHHHLKEHVSFFPTTKQANLRYIWVFPIKIWVLTPQIIHLFIGFSIIINYKPSILGGFPIIFGGPPIYTLEN